MGEQQFLSNFCTQLSAPRLAQEICRCCKLRVCAVVAIVLDKLHAVIRIIDRRRPQADVHFHCVIACKALFPERLVIQAAVDKLQRLVADTVKVARFQRNNARPGRNSALYSRVANKVVVGYHAEDMLESEDVCAVNAFADDLAQTFLQLCRKQQLACKLVQLGAVACKRRTQHTVGEVALRACPKDFANIFYRFGHTLVYAVSHVLLDYVARVLLNASALAIAQFTLDNAFKRLWHDKSAGVSGDYFVYSFSVQSIVAASERAAVVAR